MGRLSDAFYKATCCRDCQPWKQPAWLELSPEGTPPEGRGKETGKERSWVVHEKDANWEAQYCTG